MTSNGRREGLGLPTARVWLLTSPPVRRADFLAFDEALVASLPRGRQQGSQRRAGRTRREAPPIRAHGRWRPLVLVCDDRRRRFADALSKRNSAECGRDADRHRAPSASACNPKTCTSVLWDGARERRRSSLAREGADTLRGSVAATGRCDPKTSSDRCRGLWAPRCNLPPARRALQSRRVQPRGRSSVSATRACNRIWDRAGGFRSERRSRRRARR